MAEKRNAYEDFVGNPEGNRMGYCGLDLSGSRWGLVAGFQIAQSAGDYTVSF
jgi:hypothetical protein